MSDIGQPKLCKGCGEDPPYGISDYCYLCIVLGDVPGMVPGGEPCSFCTYYALDLDDLADHLELDHGMVVDGPKDLREEPDTIMLGDRAAAGLQNEAIDTLGSIAARVNDG